MLNELTKTIILPDVDGIGLLREAPSRDDALEVATPPEFGAYEADLQVARARPSPAQFHLLSILLVGDDAGCAPCLWSGLLDLGRDAKPSRRWVASLKDALTVIRNLPVDQIFCDLPDNAEGFKCLELLRKASGEIPLVALTDYDSQEIGRRLARIGIDEHLSRSNISASSLRRILRRALDRHQHKAQLDALARRERLRSAILARIAENAPLNDVLAELNQALQRELGCGDCAFAVDLNEDTAGAAQRPQAPGAAAVRRAGNCLAAAGERRPSCAACLQSIRSGARLLGELTMLSGSCAASNETVHAYAKLGVELTALAIERLHTRELLQQSQDNLKRLSEQVLNTQESERQRIAGDLHDVIGQSLSVVKVAIEDAEQNFRRGGSAEVAAILSRLIPWVKTALAEVRRISMDLRPATIDDLGMLPTLSWFLREFGASCPGIAVAPKITASEGDVPEKLKIVIFRILQEAMSNIVKHANASHIDVVLRRVDARLELVIADDGVGFDPGNRGDSVEQRPGIGLASMRERSRASGGSYALSSRPGAGTRIQVSWPLPD